MEPVARTVDTDSYMRVLSGLVAKGETVCLTITGGSRRSDDIYEMEMIRQAAAKNLPILGVCRGEQVINIAFGGTVYQDIPAQYPNALRHRQPDPGCEMTHSVKVEKGTALYALCN